MKKIKSKDMLTMTESCFDELETANALINIVLRGFEGERYVITALSKADEHIKKAIETVLQIQQNYWH